MGKNGWAEWVNDFTVGEIEENTAYNDSEGSLPFLHQSVYKIPAFDDAASAAVRSWLKVEIMDGLYASILKIAPLSLMKAGVATKKAQNHQIMMILSFFGTPEGTRTPSL